MVLANASLRVIRDSRGEKTIEVALKSGVRVARASVPHGKSRGSGEAFLMDPEKAKRLFPDLTKKIIARDFESQAEFDHFLVKFDGTTDKHKLGGNVMLGLSLAWARLKAQEEGRQLYQYVRETYDQQLTTYNLPVPMMNMINGGLHATNKKSHLSFQEFLVIPKTRDFRTSFAVGKKFYIRLHRALVKKFGKQNISLGDEAGFSAPFKNNEEALDFLTALIRRSRLPCRLALDAAATTSKKIENRNDKLGYYARLAKKHNLLSIEDPFSENDEEGFAALMKLFRQSRRKTFVVGDDLTTTNPRRIRLMEAKKAVNALILKPDQIGTLTEAVETARLAHRAGWKIIASHRSGETTDDWIADVAVGVGAWGIKAGAPATPHRLNKYKRLLAITRLSDKIAY